MLQAFEQQPVQGDQINSISGDTVKEVVFNETHKFETPCYLIDIRPVKELHRLALYAIKALINSKKTSKHTIPVYMAHISGNKETIIKLGYGEPYKLYSLIRQVSKFALSAKVYLDTGKGFKLLTNYEVYGLKLDLGTNIDDIQKH